MPTDPLSLTVQDDAESAGWPLVAVPAADLPAALAGTAAPETIVAALGDLEAMAARLDAWIAAVQADLIARINGETPPLHPPPQLDTAPWRDGAHQSVLRDEPQLAAMAPRLAGLEALAAALSMAAADARRLDTARVRDFAAAAAGCAGELRRLLGEVWNRLANIDPLTGLGNRAAMLRRLDVEAGRHARARQPCSIAVLDLDRFKDINDGFGHVVGDTVLRSLASLLAASVRPYDAVFRYAGDEFLVCFPNADLRTAWAVAERLRIRVAGWTIPIRDDRVIAATISIGIAPLHPDGTVEMAVEHADAALYRAKRQGRDCVVVFSP